MQVLPFIGGSCWVSFLPIQLAWDCKALFLLFYPLISDESAQEVAPIPCKMMQQASLHNHSISRRVRFHDHIVCAIQAIEYSMQVGPPQGVR